jgi:hypothetical protein
MPASNFANGT